MRILMLGGTVFLGRHLVEAALAQGHEITLFTRGHSNPDLFLEVERLHGDRMDGDAGLALLRQRQWDVVIDTSGYLPRIVRASAQALADSVGVYAFISSISVYASTSQPNQDESAPVGILADPSVEDVTGETYGPLKALCEQAVEAARRACAHHTAWFDRWAARSNRSLHLLAAPRGAWWRDSGAG